MNVTLIEIGGGLKAIDHSIGLCYAKYDYTDPEKRDNRITKVALKHKHSSVLEFATFTFDISASTKVLLEMTRHRMASYACQSSRYTLNKTDIVFESTGDDTVDALLSSWKLVLENMISKGKSNEVTSLMLPQAFQYNWTVMFNARSLKNFLELRRSKSAHYHIQAVAEEMYKVIPDELKYLFQEGKEND
jgi:thymidylate synthase (FAD)